MLEILFIGLSLGSILLLVALGLAITYGAMGVINMAHGEMVMLGAYTTVMSAIWLHLGFLASLPLAFIVTGLLGWAIERVVVRRLYGRLLDTLLATWGVAILIQQAVRLELGLSFLGIQVRAIMRNPRMAAACGIDVQRINGLTFAYGSGLAGVAGVMMSGFKTVFPDMGTPMVVDGFLVVVVGGVGSLLGSVLSAGMLGEINGVVASVTNDIVARAVVFGVVILIIVAKPKGLFSFKER